MIAFSCLSLRDSGVLHDLHDGQLFSDNKELVTSFRHGGVHIQEGNKLVLRGHGLKRPVTLTYGEVISHEPSLAGRGTAVLHANPSTLWKSINLVVKVSWPGSGRVAENVFLATAMKTAKRGPKDKWAVNHLPRVLFAQDVVFDPDSTHAKVASLFDNAEFVDPGCGFTYERRTLRIIVQERLYPLKTLTNVKEIAQVLLDVACGMWFHLCLLSFAHICLVHRWLYLEAGILHRDFSLNNIMCRITERKNRKGVKERKVYGVLTDFDLASWKEHLDNDYKKTSQQRTGTPPFMAKGLLDGSEPLHMYRHDLESMFYIMLILASHYEIQSPTNGERGGLRVRQGQGLMELPYQDWFNQESYKTLAFLKGGFFSGPIELNLSPSFEKFRRWLTDLHRSFWQGISSRQDYKFELQRRKDEELEDEDMPGFDNETLGGHVHYSALINPVRRLKGELEGLVIRYDP